MRNTELEDKIYEQIDMLIAMCRMQVFADTNNQEISPAIRAGFSAALEEKLLRLRDLLDQAFENKTADDSSH